MNHLKHFIKQVDRAGLAGVSLPLEYQDRAGREFIETAIRNVPSQAKTVRALYQQHGMAVALHLLMRPVLSEDEIYDLRFVGDYVDTFASWDEFVTTIILNGGTRVTKRRLRRHFRVIELLGAVYVFRRPQRFTSKGW